MDPAIILLFMSAVFIIIGIQFWQKGQHLLSVGKKADAVIVENKYSSNSRGQGAYYPVVRFQTENNEWITQKLSIGTSFVRPVGTEVEVIYDPGNPEKVEINSTFRLEVAPRLFVFIGLVLFIVGGLELLNVTSFFP